MVRPRLGLARRGQGPARGDPRTPPLIGPPPGSKASGPRIYNTLHERNALFTGREALLTDLCAALTATGRVALTGLGGVGKTQTAVEYVERHAADYDLIWWVRAEQPATLAADYAALAAELELPQRADPDQGVVIAAVRDCLERCDRWLLLFDNAEGAADLSDCRPRRGGHVIATSRAAARWEEEVWTCLPTPPFTPAEATGYLLRRARSAETKPAEAIAALLGGLPLALAQAAAYVTASGCTLTHYLGRLRANLAATLARGAAPESYRNVPVHLTWELAFQRLAEEAPAAAQLLQLCAFLAPDGIALAMLRAGAEFLPEPLAATVRDDGALDAAVVALRRYSLVERRAGALDVHRLVQEVTRARMDAAGRVEWAAAAAQVMGHAFPEDAEDVRYWSACECLLHHALAVTGHAKMLGEASGILATLHLHIGRYSYGRAQYENAKDHFARSLALAERCFGTEHPDVAEAANDLALVLRAQGDLTGARPLIERALAITERALGPDHPTVATRLNNLAFVLHDQGDLAGARTRFERALAITERALGPDHPTVATGLNNLALVLQDQGDLAGARPLIERALAIGERALGPDHPDVATRLNNLAAVLRAQGDLAGARTRFERALAMREKALGPDHPDTAQSLNNLAAVLRDRGDLAGARVLIERALAITERALGPDHPTVATRLNNLATVLQDQGDLAGARPLFERALAIWEARLGPQHPNTQTARRNLAALDV